MSKTRKQLKNCPVCGGKLTVSCLYQYSLDFVVTKSGKVSKRYKKCDGGSMECSNVSCENNDFMTDFEMTVTEPIEYQGKRVYWEPDDALYMDSDE